MKKRLIILAILIMLFVGTSVKYIHKNTNNHNQNITATELIPLLNHLDKKYREEMTQCGMKEGYKVVTFLCSKDLFGMCKLRLVCRNVTDDLRYSFGSLPFKSRMLLMGNTIKPETNEEEEKGIKNSFTPKQYECFCNSEMESPPTVTVTFRCNESEIEYDKYHSIKNQKMQILTTASYIRFFERGNSFDNLKNITPSEIFTTVNFNYDPSADNCVRTLEEAAIYETPDDCSGNLSFSVWASLNQGRNLSLLFELESMGFSIAHVSNDDFTAIEGDVGCSTFKRLQQDPRISSIRKGEYNSIRPWLNEPTIQWLDDKLQRREGLPIGPRIGTGVSEELGYSGRVPIVVFFRTWMSPEEKEAFVSQIKSESKNGEITLLTWNNWTYGFSAIINSVGLTMIRNNTELSRIQWNYWNYVNATGEINPYNKIRIILKENATLSNITELRHYPFHGSPQGLYIPGDKDVLLNKIKNDPAVENFTFY